MCLSSLEKYYISSVQEQIALAKRTRMAMAQDFNCCECEYLKVVAFYAVAVKAKLN